MKRILTLALCLLWVASAAQAQSFWRKHKKYQRSYITHSVTAPVRQPDRPSEYAQQSKARNVYKLADLDESKTKREVRKEMRHQRRMNKEAARIAKREDDRKYREEKSTLGKQLALHVVPNRGVGR